LLALLPDEQLRRIAGRRLAGYKNAEIAKELGVIERTVERRLQLIRSLWSEEISKYASF
jgi:DNA-directed RNA polymerase specialized sigma24 family protein